jgi:uncharacterized RDD family membrane protein YckC
MTYPPNSDPYANQTPPGAPYGAPPQAQYGYGAPAVAYASWIQRVGAYLVDAIYWIFLLLALVVQGYNRWFQAGKTGQSWGKKVVGIRLVSEQTGQPIGAGMAFLRDLAHFVDGIICYIGFLFPLWDAKKQTLADKIVKTLVVR